MPGKLYLTSGGYIDGQYGEKMDKVFKEECSNKRILIVDNGTITGSNKKGPMNAKENFNEIGAEVDIITLTQDNLDIIFDYDVIYISGGDCAPLAFLADTTDAGEYLLKYLSKGGIVVGESSGSILFGNDFKWYYDVKKGTKPKYDVVLPSWKGLGLVDDIIYPHYDKANDSQKEKIREYCKENNVNINCMEDDDWIEYNYLDLVKKNTNNRR